MKRPKQSGGPDLADAPPAVLSNPRLIKVEMPFSSAVDTHRVIYTIPPFPIPYICHGSHGYTRVNFFLAGVKFYRFNAKNWQFTV